LTTADGIVSYRRRFNDNDQITCDRFDGTTWKSLTAPRTDLGYLRLNATTVQCAGPGTRTQTNGLATRRHVMPAIS
jgi:hypothetical protein